MILLPAIDILGGQTVRLARGDFDHRTVYDADPVDAARRWVAAGARALHIVDLDGARAGEPVNVEHVRRITEAVDVPVQVGGGLRGIESVRQVVAAGASRVILGTAAYSDIDFLDAAVAELRERLIVSVDVRQGRVAGAGWTEQTDIPATSVFQTLGHRGVRRFVYSNIERDGMLGGPDLDEVREVAGTVRGTFVYSGGIASVQDLEALVALRQVNLVGVIVGTALYEGQLDVTAAQAALARGGNHR